jgi:hypothetical protein
MNWDPLFPDFKEYLEAKKELFIVLTLFYFLLPYYAYIRGVLHLQKFL